MQLISIQYTYMKVEMTVLDDHFFFFYNFSVHRTGYRLVYIYKLKRSIYCCYIPVEPHQRPHHTSFFLFSIIFFFPLSLPQIQLGLSVFYVSLFSINCAFSVSFLVLMFALKSLLLNKSD